MSVLSLLLYNYFTGKKGLIMSNGEVKSSILGPGSSPCGYPEASNQLEPPKRGTPSKPSKFLNLRLAGGPPVENVCVAKRLNQIL